MKEKLTRADVWDWINPTRDRDRDGLCESFWSQIEADREAIRAETREELLRDHFKIGEEVRTDDGRQSLFICAKPREQIGLAFGPKFLSRPSKKRAKSPTELVADFTRYAYANLKGNDLMFAIMSVWGNPETADMDFLRDYCRDHGIATEVDE